ncbi:MAG: hypothetical protein AB9866_29645 [Syntrophobacteraceae bacterium]
MLREGLAVTVVRIADSKLFRAAFRLGPAARFFFAPGFLSLADGLLLELIAALLFVLLRGFLDSFFLLPLLVGKGLPLSFVLFADLAFVCAPLPL